MTLRLKRIWHFSKILGEPIDPQVVWLFLNDANIMRMYVSHVVRYWIEKKKRAERDRENKVWDIVALSEVVIVLLVVSSGNNEKKSKYIHMDWIAMEDWGVNKSYLQPEITYSWKCCYRIDRKWNLYIFVCYIKIQTYVCIFIYSNIYS